MAKETVEEVQKLIDTYTPPTNVFQHDKIKVVKRGYVFQLEFNIWSVHNPNLKFDTTLGKHRTGAELLERLKRFFES